MQEYVIQEHVSIFPQFDNINSILGYGPRIWKPSKQCPLSNVIDTGFTNFHIPLYYISRNYFFVKTYASQSQTKSRNRRSKFVEHTTTRPSSIVHSELFSRCLRDRCYFLTEKNCLRWRLRSI